MIDNDSKLLVWEATQSPGQPVCVADNVRDDNLTASFYLDDDGAVMGIMIHDGPTLVGAFGLLPANAVEEEIEYASY